MFCLPFWAKIPNLVSTGPVNYLPGDRLVSRQIVIGSGESGGLCKDMLLKIGQELEESVCKSSGLSRVLNLAHHQVFCPMWCILVMLAYVCSEQAEACDMCVTVLSNLLSIVNLSLLWYLALSAAVLQMMLILPTFCRERSALLVYNKSDDRSWTPACL